MSEEQRKTKDRSPNFPFINLAQALGKAQQFYAAEKKGAAPFRVAAGHWSYSPSSSGAFQTAAALKSYGLMIDEESGEKRSVRLTDLALRILLDQRPDSPDKPRLMRQAALSPTIAEEVYHKWSGTLPSKPTLHHYLVLDRGFGESKAHSVVKILYENQELTGIDSSDVVSRSTEIDNEAPKEESFGAEPMPENLTVKTVVASPNASSNIWAKPDRIAFGNAEVIFNWGGSPPSAAVFEFFQDYMVFRKKHAEADAKAAASASSVSEPDKK